MSRPRRALTAEETFCLEGWLATGDSSTAYRLSHNSQSGDPLNIQKMASRWLNRPECKEYCETRRRANYKAAKEEHPNATANRGRSDAVTELNALISATDDPKIKGDLLLKLADLNRWKQAENEADREKLVRYYIPLQVDRCWEYFARTLATYFRWSKADEDKAIELMRHLPQPNKLPTREELNEQIRKEDEAE